MVRGRERAVAALRPKRDLDVRACGRLPAPAGAQHEQRGVGERPRMRARVVRMPAPRPAAVVRPLRPEGAARREIPGDVVEHRLRRADVVRVADAPPVAQERVRVRDAAHPRDVHRVARALAVEADGLDEPRRIVAVVPAVEAPRRQLGRLLDGHPGRVFPGTVGPFRDQVPRQRPAPVAVVLRELEGDALARLPAVRLHIRRHGCTRAIVAQRLLAVREVEPDRGPPVAVREADAGLAERRPFGRDEAAAARKDGRRRAAVRAERP